MNSQGAFQIGGSPSLSTYNLFRNYNYLIGPQNADHYSKIHTSRLPTSCIFHTQDLGSVSCGSDDKQFKTIKPYSTPSAIFGVHHVVPGLFDPKFLDVLNGTPNLTDHCTSQNSPKRHRGEKKRIPDEQKDEKYFERRKRNNQAAKKSRDARKLREDQVALRAAVLEHENAILKAQILTLQEETASLRHMVFQKRAFELASRETSDRTS